MFYLWCLTFADFVVDIIDCFHISFIGFCFGFGCKIFKPLLLVFLSSLSLVLCCCSSFPLTLLDLVPSILFLNVFPIGFPYFCAYPLLLWFVSWADHPVCCFIVHAFEFRPMIIYILFLSDGTESVSHVCRRMSLWENIDVVIARSFMLQNETNFSILSTPCFPTISSFPLIFAIRSTIRRVLSLRFVNDH